MYDPRTVTIPPGYGKIRFSGAELRHILVAVGALTLAFTIFLLGGAGSLFAEGLSPVTIAYAAVISFIAVLTGFMLHELGHKISAQRSGAWAEFRSYPFGLMLSVVFSFLGFIIALPGAVYIQGMISRKQNGVISLSGPATNLALGAAFVLGAAAVGDGIVGFALYWIGSINFLLAAFNLLPIPPLDGSKVLRWSVPAYVAVFALAVVMAGLVYTGMLADILL